MIAGRDLPATVFLVATSLAWWGSAKTRSGRAIVGMGLSTTGMRLSVIAAGIAAASIASAAHAATTFNTSLVDPPGFYNGTGNPNEGFTVNEHDGVELGIGVQYRVIGPQVHPTSTNVYNVATGVYVGPGTCVGCAKWNFEFSVNLQAFDGNAGLHLNQITPSVSILNVGNGQSFTFNPFITTPDNSGWNGSVKNAASANLTTDFGFQNSENLGFGFYGFLGSDVNQNATYLITLSALQTDGSVDLGSVQALIIVGDGAQTPLPAALPLFASGLGVFGFIAARRKRKNKPVATSA